MGSDGSPTEGDPGKASVPGEGDARQRALVLLEATHQFPCDYAITVIAFNREAVTAAVRTAAARGDDGSVRHEVRPSSAGKYLSHRLAVRVSVADEVLDLYARLKAIDGVVTIF